MRFYDFLAVLFKGAQVDKTLGNIFMTNVIMRQLSHLNEEKKEKCAHIFVTSVIIFLLPR